MKELTIEEKAKRYGEALERTKKLQETCDSMAVVGWCEYIFPELKEPNDERIRKALIEYFGEQCDMSDWNGVYGYQVLAWLEKQGHMLHPDRVIEWLESNQPNVWVVGKFKKDFGL